MAIQVYELDVGKRNGEAVGASAERSEARFNPSAPTGLPDYFVQSHYRPF